MSISEAINDWFSRRDAAASNDPEPRPAPVGPLSAEALLERGAVSYVHDLDALFATDGGWAERQGLALFMFDEKSSQRMRPRLHAIPHFPADRMGFVSRTDAVEWLAIRAPSLADLARGLGVYVVAIVDDRSALTGMRVALFTRLPDGTWVDSDGMRERVAAEVERRRAEALAAYEAREAAAKAARDAEEHRQAEVRAQLEAQLAEHRKVAEAAAAKAAAEAERRESERLDSIAQLSMDPATVIAVCEVLDLVDDAGKLRTIVRETDLVHLDGRVFASPGALAAIDEAFHGDRRRAREIGHSKVFATAAGEANRRGRRPLHVDFTVPPRTMFDQPTREAELVDAEGDILAVLVDDNGTVRVLHREERAPLHWFA